MNIWIIIFHGNLGLLSLNVSFRNPYKIGPGRFPKRFVIKRFNEDPAPLCSLGTKRNAAGILQVISGFFSLLICISQLLNNEAFHRPCFPTCPMSPYNEVDVMAPYSFGQPVPVAAQPVPPVM